MTELIGRYAAADDREQMGRFLRHAFPLGLASFTELLSMLKDYPRAQAKPPPTNRHD